MAIFNLKYYQWLSLAKCNEGAMKQMHHVWRNLASAAAAMYVLKLTA